MFSSALGIVSLLVCMLVVWFVTQKNYSADFHRILWKSGARARKKRLDFVDSPDRIMLGLGLR